MFIRCGKITRFIKCLFRKFEIFFEEIGKISGIHGFQHIFNRQYHWIERFLWFILFNLTMYWGINIGLTQYQRFLATPTVISLDRNYRFWNGTLPAVTLCYHDHLDSFKADIYIQETWNVTIMEPNYFRYLEFLYAVVNSTVENYLEITRFAEEDDFEKVDLFDLSQAIDSSFQQLLISFDNDFDIPVDKVMTERGWCYAINSPMSEILKEKNFKVKTMKKPITCQYNKQKCFIRLDIHENTATVQVHSPYEISSSDNAVIHLKRSDEITATYKVSETIASDSLRDLTPSQRKCVFYDENTSNLPIYSKSLCLAKCRAAMALEMCNCVPYFYPFIEGPSCTPSGFECLLDFKWPVWASHICNCPNTCFEESFSLNTIKKTIWSSSKFETISSFRWNVIPPKVRIKRDILFSYEDLLVSFGGTGALFLGGSFFAGFKIIYFLIEELIKLIKYLVDSKWKQQQGKEIRK